MAKKIFISYKYSDENVQSLDNSWNAPLTTARSYVDIIQNHFEDTGVHIFKGENNSESLEAFKDDAIRSKLAEKIYDSSITIVLISPNMKEWVSLEKDQWIPWEISYSLKRKTRNTISSTPNAILAIILPDRYGSYEYARNSNFGFEIINKNRNNLNYRYPATRLSNGCSSSYILQPTWKDFTSNYNGWIEAALEIRQNIDKYEISKSV
ncbi:MULTISPECIES: TIR domain-containing protein [Psychrobacter]|uniref:TIR domain-containing protein n=1 Tax=Psychrobacter TaxID=497 RepID=UPI000EBD8CAE|nr:MULTISPECIES: TIR domain-containing protein [Psychrobacter]HCT74311.1 molecular chaperone Tir [Psychrobacter sp.]